MSKKTEETKQPEETPAVDDVLLTVHKATEVLIRGRALAWRWAAEGKIQADRQAGGMSRVKLSDILRAIEEVARR